MSKTEFKFDEFKNMFELVNAISNKRSGEEEYVVFGNGKMSKLTSVEGAGVLIEVPHKMFADIDKPVSVNAELAAKFLNQPNVEDTLRIERVDEDKVAIHSGNTNVTMSGMPSYLYSDASSEQQQGEDVEAEAPESVEVPALMFSLNASFISAVPFALIGTRRTVNLSRSYMRLDVAKDVAFSEGKLVAKFRSSDSFVIACADCEECVIETNEANADISGGVILHEEMWRHIITAVNKHGADTITFAQKKNAYVIALRAANNIKEEITVTKLAESWHIPEDKLLRIVETKIQDYGEPSETGELALDEDEKKAMLAAFKFLDSITTDDSVILRVNPGEVLLSAQTNSKNAQTSVKVKAAKGDGSESWINSTHSIKLLSLRYGVSLSCLPGGFKFVGEDEDAPASRLRLYAAFAQ